MTIPFEHGVAVFARGDEVAGGALSLPGLEPFSQQLPADVAQLRGWVTGGPGRLLTAIVAGGWDFSLIVELRRLAPAVYVIVWHADAVEDAHNRIRAFQSGARMVSHDAEHLQQALQLITSIRGAAAAAADAAAAGEAAAAAEAGLVAPGTIAQLSYACPWCGLSGLTGPELWLHQPLYHIYELDKTKVDCPMCRHHTSRLTRHINLQHNPAGPGTDERTGVYALAVVRRPGDGKFLLVQERYGEGYWVPGGGVDPGESLVGAVVREAWEEAGARIKVTGILALESSHRGSWRRIIFLAEPLPQPQPLPAAVASTAASAASAPGDDARALRRCKTLPDVESAGACWVAAEELEGLPLRCVSEPRTWIPWVAGGGKVAALDPASPELTQLFPDYPLV
ncbi:hypothetical protein CHLRE_08g385450v5 [Chlamydomonas reinhardtii]|uniref:Uncharacterized protein n=1 Tax=Chlamydomonas reinhardtii TaxID=3055 RepID=A8IYY6_CHLRE|nr:uncharacterized protein CHLRE_08g385450v5 [Chlamydomonas reinhardtii]PNW80285.1 hypothetical protein CHLRE_08g385450v5 [Chlamydomonas reinhardtii]|eukprot:XP_001694296.1 predicted protein [Chlamydomonas reinhardtii]